MGAFLLQAIGGTVAEIGLDDDRIGDQLLQACRARSYVPGSNTYASSERLMTACMTCSIRQDRSRRNRGSCGSIATISTISLGIKSRHHLVEKQEFGLRGKSPGKLEARFRPATVRDSAT